MLILQDLMAKMKYAANNLSTLTPEQISWLPRLYAEYAFWSGPYLSAYLRAMDEVYAEKETK